ncbi:TraR/DksA C4-type zinc finger protein [Acidovorax kalamii]|uniref:TraR/DksA C4-type zinc finger protein n=1 Tax=Acidovorax kalamii TaxID=2004485 RepID=UPI002090D9EF|nr:TraR/DksA C4-type zinc finger protein [Acidovorax kalamii]MCO5354226.1 TraR/DksA C4-type zinc finger protein [Acidovorax kalamii]
MTDDIDRAQAREAELLADALRDHTRHARKGLGAVSAQECGACGESIPEERRAAQPGCQFCVACQARAEKTNKGARAR